MKLDADDARERFTAAPVARLATVGAEGVPHLVPVTFAVTQDRLYFAVDHKPKTTWNLRRLRNVRENPRVALLADHYADDWSTLWWARADGHATILPDDAERERALALRLLAEKYPQYASSPPAGPVVTVEIVRWSGWTT
jgi:PPOX class probable F420-dependent enzyme